MTYIKTINIAAICISSAMVFCGFALRAYRWQIILQHSKKITYAAAYHPVMIGFMLNATLPARAGELARPAILYKKNQVPLSTGISSIVLERLFDFVFLSVSFVFILLFVDMAPDKHITFAGFTLDTQKLMSLFIKTVLLCCGLVFISSILSLDFLKRFSSKILHNITSVFTTLRHSGPLFGCAATTLLIWGLIALSQYVMVLGSPGMNLTFFQSFALLVIVCFFISIPSVPGYWGIWEAGGLFALSLFGSAGPDAAGFTLVNHAVQLFPAMIAGLFSLVYISRTGWSK